MVPKHFNGFTFVVLLIAVTVSAADRPARDLANATNGGAIVRFSAGATNLAALNDASKRQKLFGAPAKFPQEIVFAFRGDREALVGSVVVTPGAKATNANWPRRVAIAISTNSPIDGFEEATVASLEEEPGAQSIPIQRRARFVAVRVLDNFGGKSLSLDRISIHEGAAPGYASILDHTNLPPAAPAVPGRDGHEPNNSAAAAKPLALGRGLDGAINPVSDEDWFTLKVPGKTATALTFLLEGRPYIRTSLGLLRGTELVKQFDPGRSAVERTEFSWLVEPGEYSLRLAEPPASIVLIWDSSSSMKGSEKDLQRAVDSFLGQVKAPDRLQLIQFSGKIQVLTTNFTSDSAELLEIFRKNYKLTQGTAFFDAVRRGSELLENVPGNRAIVVMTDGADSQSKVAYPEFWRELGEKRIRLYTVGLGKELTRFSERTAGVSHRTLGHMALSSNGKFFFTEKSEQLLDLYQNISDELHSRSSYSLDATVSRGQGTLSVSATSRRTITTGTLVPLEIIFDSSGSMREKIDHRRKIEIMKDVMTKTIDALAEQQTVALRVFGHRVDSQKPAALTDSELIFPPARIDKTKLRDTIQNLQARGTTPIAHSLAQLTKDLAGVEGEKHIVLVTDGREEAGGDPVKAVKTLLAQGLKFRLNVVGFALAEQESKDQMKTIAEMTGGRFYDASSAAGLRDAVEQSMVDEVLKVPFEVLDGAGAKVADGTTGANGLPLPEGIFALKIQTPGKPTIIQAARVEKGKATRLVLTREGDAFTTRAEVSETR